MRSVAIVSACFVVAAVTATVSTSVSYASQPDSTLGEVSPITSFGPAPLPSMIALESKELAVYTSQGISPEVASQALRLQGEVAKTGLVEKIVAALGDSYAGVWFEPSAAKFHVGVTSNASRVVAKRVAAQVGLAADVVESPVRSTTAALVAAQGGWSRKLARLLASGSATTGLDPPHNAVSVTIDSSLPSAQRNALRRDAAESRVNVLVHVSHPAQQKDAAKKNCVSTFAEGSAYCEEAITAGVTIREAGAPEPCTSGPILIEGNETYMLTAGHCVGGTTPAIGSPVEAEITSKYTEGPSLEIGKEGTRYLNTERDMADVRVNRAAKNFTEPLPDPAPALMAEWEKKPKTPHLVGGVKEAMTVPKQAVCHEGQTSGERCGEVTELNVEGGSEPTKHLVRTSACSEGGDSGGPFFFRVEATGEILMMGLLTSGSGSCAMPPATANFEPLLDLPEAPTFGILSTYPRKDCSRKQMKSDLSPNSLY
jgi:streptogrisin C